MIKDVDDEEGTVVAANADLNSTPLCEGLRCESNVPSQQRQSEAFGRSCKDRVLFYCSCALTGPCAMVPTIVN